VESKQILLNKDAIAVSQDPLGKMGIRHKKFSSNSSTQMWSRELHNGDIAVALYNKAVGSRELEVPQADAAVDITLSFADVGLGEKVSVYDIWAQKNLGTFAGSFTAKNVPKHGTAFFRLSGSASVIV